MLAISQFFARMVPIIGLALAFFALSSALNFFNLQAHILNIMNASSSAPSLYFFIILVGSYLETVVLISLYFPGSVILILGLIAADHHPLLITLLIAAVNLGVGCGLLTNYKFALRLSERWPSIERNWITQASKRYLAAYDWIWVALAAWHPNWLGSTFFALGLAQSTASRHSLLALIMGNAYIALYILLTDIVSKSLDVGISNHHYYVSAAIIFFGAVYNLTITIRERRRR